jgi:hypothetical protein
MVDAEVLLDDVCCDEPGRVAASLQAAHGRGEELAPLIVARLDAALAAPTGVKGDDAQYLGFLLHLAAEFRVRAAHARIARLLRLDVEIVYRLFGETTTADGGPILAETYDGDSSPLIGLIEDAAAGPFARGAGMFALAILVRRGQFPRAAMLAVMVKLAATLVPERESDATVANGLVENAVRLHAHEIHGTIMELYERGLAEEGYIESDYTGPALEADASPAREAGELDRRIDDAWEEVRYWHFFSDKSAPHKRAGTSAKLADRRVEPGARTPSAVAQAPSSAPHRAPRKVGRNEPCPCGSGRKFKKCCGR